MKTINKIIPYILLLIGFIYLIKYALDKDISRALLALINPIIVLIPNVFKKKLNDKLILIYYFYIFILLTLGCLARFYSRIEYYDVFAHFMFGFLGSLIGLYLLGIFKLDKNIIFNIIFMIFTTLAISALWEIFEYIVSIVFKEDVQYALTTGVKDTMEDIISATISSIIFVFIYYFNKEKIHSLVKIKN